LATRPTQGDLNELTKHQVDPNQAVRYWVACGLLLRAQENQQRDQAVKTAGGMTVDPSPYVRCMACETVARYGKPMDRKLALDALLNMSDPRITNTLVAVAALNSLDWCDPTSAEIGQRLQGLPANVPTLSKRYDTLIPKLLKRFESRVP
jgi:hypothetical protein